MDRAVVITLKIDQASLNDAEISIISSAVAFVLSIPTGNVHKQIYDHTARRDIRNRD